MEILVFTDTDFILSNLLITDHQSNIYFTLYCHAMLEYRIVGYFQRKLFSDISFSLLCSKIYSAKIYLQQSPQ